MAEHIEVSTNAAETPWFPHPPRPPNNEDDQQRHHTLLDRLLAEKGYLENLPQEMIVKRQKDDYMRQMVEWVESHIDYSYDVDNILQGNFNQASFLFSRQEPSPDFVTDIEYDTDDYMGYGDPIYVQRRVPPVFDVDAIAYIISRKEQIRQILPKLAELADTLEEAKNKLHLFFPDQQDQYTIDHIVFIQSLDPSTDPCSSEAQELIHLKKKPWYRGIYQCSKDTSKKDFISL